MAKPATTSHLQEQSHLSPDPHVMHWQLKPQSCPSAAWQTLSPAGAFQYTVSFVTNPERILPLCDHIRGKPILTIVWGFQACR